MQKQITYILEKTLPTHEFKTVCTHLFNQPGKLFRPRLIHCLADDLNYQHSNNLLSLSSFIEIHHTYTLIHDDLPAMDDDDIRRGIISTHKKFSDASAILAGDALLIASFSALTHIKSSELPSILKLATWTTGAKGLISGQFFDLTNNKKTYEEILRIHELKTSRLFQFCTMSTYILSSASSSQKELRRFMRLGSLIGLIFQILDDFDDANDSQADYNNLVTLDKERAIKDLNILIKRFTQICKTGKLEKTYQQIINYTKSQNVSF